MPKILISGGNFQSASGVPLAGGYVTFRLNTDARVDDSQVSAGRVITFPLDSNGNLSGLIWPNDQMNPNNTVYFVQAFTAAGQLVWEQQLFITTSGSDFA